MAELQRREEAGATERQVWEEAVRRGTERAFREYMLSFPDGRYEQEARDRIEVIRQENAVREEGLARAQSAEDNLGLNDVTRRLVEARLGQLGLDPGTVDGRFDEASRRALRRYQSERGLNATGYMDEGTLIRLLADSFGELR